MPTTIWGPCPKCEHDLTFTRKRRTLWSMLTGRPAKNECGAEDEYDEPVSGMAGGGALCHCRAAAHQF